MTVEHFNCVVVGATTSEAQISPNNHIAVLLIMLCCLFIYLFIYVACFYLNFLFFYFFFIFFLNQTPGVCWELQQVV